MPSLKIALTDLLLNALQRAFPEHALTHELIEVTLSTQVAFGHYQCNSAMRLGKTLGLAPREIATLWQKALTLDGLIAKCEVAGPGFLNLWLNPQLIADRLNLMADSDHFGIKHTPHRIVIDFSSPNIAKQMHVGHLRSTIIGDCLARIFEYLGFDVLRLNHIGDWGTAFGMLIAYLKTHQPAVLTGQCHTDLNHLVGWYRDSKKIFDEDTDFKKTAQLEVIELQSGNPESLHAWQIICDISKTDYQQIYDLLDIRLTERGESFYNPFLAETVDDLTAKGLVSLSDGAKCIFLPGFINRDNEPLPLIIQKSDGGYNYASTDLAAVKHRVEVEHASRILYLTDAGQGQHFSMIFKAADLAGYLNHDNCRVRVDHVPFGLVLGPDGKKFKTRSGDTEPLIDLIFAAIKEAARLLQERALDLDAAALENTAHILGVNALKYADLANNRIHDYVFSYERMLRFDGNTAAFLMYAYVRIQSLKRRAQTEPAIYLKVPLQLKEPAELDLALHLLRFEEILTQVAEDLLPNRLCEYLFNLAEKFNVFFRDCRVEGVSEQNARLHLCDLTAHLLKTGMNLLGLQTIEKM